MFGVNERIRRIDVQNSEQEALQELINMEATGDYDSKRQAHLDELRQQYNQGELPEHLNAVFENRTKFSTIPVSYTHLTLPTIYSV